MQALKHIKILLNKKSYTCFQLGLPEVECIGTAEEKNLENEKIMAKENFSKSYDKLTANQRNIFDKLTNFPSDKLYFIDGPGGSGKTFLYETSIYYFIATGIASILLPKGMTRHRTFRLPLDLNDIEISTLKVEIDKNKLREADIIIWDEDSIIPKKL